MAMSAIPTPVLRASTSSGNASVPGSGNEDIPMSSFNEPAIGFASIASLISPAHDEGLPDFTADIKPNEAANWDSANPLEPPNNLSKNILTPEMLAMDDERPDDGTKSEDSEEDEETMTPVKKSRLYFWLWENLSFRTLHVLFFVLLLLVLTALIFIWREDPTLAFVDGLFMVASAITGSGLSSVPMEALNEYQQCVLFFGMILGSLVFTSLLPVFIRRSYLKAAIEYLQMKRQQAFKRHADELKAAAVAHNGNGTSTGSGLPTDGRTPKYRPGARSFTTPGVIEQDTESHLGRRGTVWAPPGWPYVPMKDDVPLSPMVATAIDLPTRGIKFKDDPRPAPSLYEYDHSPLHGGLVRRRTIAVSDEAAKMAMARMKHAARRTSVTTMSSLKKLPSAIPELDALNYLIVFILGYLLIPSLIGSLISCVWLIFSPSFRNTISNAGIASTPPNLPPDNANAYFFAIFMNFSAFTNCGMSTVSPGALLFLNGGGGPMPYLLVSLTFMGFTLSPFFMRWITLFLRWLEAKRLGRSKELGETLGKRRKSVWTDNASRVAVVEARSSRLLDAMDFLLEHPRRVYTLMFRATETRWIFLVNVGMCFFGFLIYLILEWNNSVTIGIPERNWDFWFAGWFQESNVRNTGMAIFDLNAVSPGLLIYYTVSMYVAIFPIAMVRRKTNVYVERDLMIDVGKKRDGGFGTAVKRWIRRLPDERTRKEREADLYMLSRLKNQMFGDITFVITCIFLIVSVEESRQLSPPLPVFNIIFEVISAFGNVGLSLGYPGTYASLSGVFTPFSKFIMILVFMVGRHRGLPDNVDKSVQIPGISEVVESAHLWSVMDPSIDSDDEKDEKELVEDGLGREVTV